MEYTYEIPAFVRYVQALKAQYDAKHGPLSAELTAEFIERARTSFGASGGQVLNRHQRRKAARLGRGK